MRVVYGHPKCTVWRPLTVPEDSLNALPYLRRGWCFFESGVSIVGSAACVTIEDGQRRNDAKSPVPFVPARFAKQVQDLHFTNKRTDAEVVISLYNHIFSKLSPRALMRRLSSPGETTRYAH